MGRRPFLLATRLLETSRPRPNAGCSGEPAVSTDQCALEACNICFASAGSDDMNSRSATDSSPVFLSVRVARTIATLRRSRQSGRFSRSHSMSSLAKHSRISTLPWPASVSSHRAEPPVFSCSLRKTDTSSRRSFWLSLSAKR